jgi:alpha-L-fucosidase 2
MPVMETKLWYNSPAREWKEGLPVGNGRLAAMLHGTSSLQRLSLNHEWLWRGRNRLKDNEKASQHLQEVRKLLLRGDYAEGTRLGHLVFGGRGGVSGQENRVDPYQPAGDLCCRLSGHRAGDYRRELDLDSAVATVTVGPSGAAVVSETAALTTRPLIVHRLSCANRPFGFTMWLERRHDPLCTLEYGSEEELLWMDGAFDQGVSFRVEVHLCCPGGKTRLEPGPRLAVQETREALLFIRMGTSARGRTPREECNRTPIPAPRWKDLLDEHVARYRALYHRLNLDLSSPEIARPTDERIRRL